MKKIILILIMLGSFTIAGAQTEKEYNPYRNPREEYIQSGREIFSSYKDIDCNEKEVKTRTSTDKSIYYSDSVSSSSKREAIKRLSKIKCQELVDFFIDVISNEADKEMRYDAVQYLGWQRAKSSVPFLLEFAKNENELSYVNKIAITLCVMEEFDIAASILDKVCFNEDGSINRDCIVAYEYAGRTELARNFWLLEWDKHDDEESKFHIALKLTEYGIYDISFPVIKKIRWCFRKYAVLYKSIVYIEKR